MRDRPLLIIKTGSTLPELIARRGDFEHWFAAGLGLARDALQVVAVQRNEPLPSPEAVGGVVVTGSPAMVTAREPWSERTAGWLREAVSADTAIFGVCYGHQLLAHALGGEVGQNPLGVELGTKEVRLTETAAHDALFTGFPSSVALQLTHEESVLRLPEGARLLARTAQDPCCAFAFAFGERAWGVQFHPEFDADIIRDYLRARAERLRRDGQHPASLLAEARDSPWGTRLLERFAALAGVL